MSDFSLHDTKADEIAHVEEGHARVRVTIQPADHVLELIEVMYGLANLGHTNAPGVPTPLWAAAALREYRDVTVRRPRGG